MTQDQFSAWIKECDISMRKSDQFARHMRTADAIRAFDPELAALYAKWAETQLAIGEHISESALRLAK